MRVVWLGWLGIAFGFAALAQSAPQWQRAWTVQSIDCSSCAPDERSSLDARLGEQIVFGARTFINPFYEDCLDKVDYSDIRPRSRTEARNFLGPGRLPHLTE